MNNYVIGKQPVLEVLKSGTSVEKVFLLHSTRPETARNIRQLAKRKGIPVVEMDGDRFREIVPAEHSQGIAALVSSVSYVEPEDLLEVAKKKGEPPLLLVLDEIEDPQNLGALIRTADCSGVHGVIIPKHHSAPITETVTKTSAGATAHVPVARVTNIVQTIEQLKLQGVWVIGSDSSGTTSFYDADYRGPVALVIGNEGKGIRRLVKEKCDFLVRIPMFGKIESLNASVSGALLMYEAVRARRAGQKSER